MVTEHSAGRLRDLLAASALIGRGAPIEETLDQWMPYLLPQIAADRAADEFDHWGQSTVLDENTGTPVLPRALCETLHAHAGLPSSWPVGNAGVLHVYGYLLSTVATPYGFKRERWTGGGLADALGRDPTHFLPWDANPDTLLRRVTEAVLPVLIENPPGSTTVMRFDEAVGTVGDAFFRTAIVSNRSNDHSALIYGVGQGSDIRVVTAFPVAQPTDAWLTDLRSEPPRPRYNVATG
jgi:hypothetical protein